jgi:NAD(P)H-hydrate epimerase
MKRGANVALAPQAASANPDEALQPPGAPHRKTKSLVEEDDAPSTADGVVLDLPAETSSADTTASPVAGESSGEAAENQKAKTETSPDRTPLAELLARGTGCVVVLKGHRSVVTDGIRSTINSTGNPAMATAGAGDVLTGMIASLLGQKMNPLEAAILATHVHGEAGDLARAAIAPHAVGILSTDIIAHIPHALANHIGA